MRELLVILREAAGGCVVLLTFLCSITAGAAVDSRLSVGNGLIIENAGEDPDPALAAVLRRNLAKAARSPRFAPATRRAFSPAPGSSTRRASH